MARDVQIPLVLWMCAAIVAHSAGGGGAVVATRAAERIAAEREEILEAVRDVRREVRGGSGMLEVEMVALPPPDLPLPPPVDGPVAAKADGNPDDAEERSRDEVAKNEPAEIPRDAETPKPPEPKPELTLPQLQPPPPAQPPPPPPEEAPPEQADTPKPPLEPPPEDRRIAVVQHVRPDQEDNPDAPRIADEANKVDEETMARDRSFDQDHADPTPGTNLRGPADQVGNDETTDVAHSEDKPGDPAKAPGEAAPAAAAATHAAPPPPAPPNADRPSASGAPGAPGTPGSPDQPRGASAPDPGSPGGSGPASPEAVVSDRGGYTLDPTNPGGDGRARQPGEARKPAPFSQRIDVRALGLGGTGLPGGPAMNLTQDLVERAVGPERLAAERASAGASLRSRRTGRLDTNKFERWRPAIENYDPSVKLGNQTSLNAARVVYAGYLNHIHNRIHPIFAEEFLGSLDRIARGDTLNDHHMIAHVEIVLRKEDGAITRIGITRNSGSTVFDAAALESIHRASPFGGAPEAIASPDGLVYLHWEFHRDPHDACSSRNAKPYLLTASGARREAPRRPTPPEAPSEATPPRGGPAGAPRPGAPRAPRRRAK